MPELPSPDPRSSMWNLIAWYLRCFRRLNKLNGEDVGDVIGGGKAAVSRIETGKERMTGTQAERLDTNYNTGGIFSQLVFYASVGHDPEWFAQMTELEQKSDMIRIFEAQVIPGLLQTEDYTRALAQGGIDLNHETVVADRIRRQELLHRDNPPHLTAIVPQPVLEWVIGSRETMRKQIAHLIELAERPNIVFRVVPHGVGSYPGLSGSFWLLSGEGFGEIAYTEAPGSGRLVSAPTEVRRHGIRYERINAKALTEEPSMDLLRKILEDYA